MATESSESLAPGTWHERISWADRLALRPLDWVDVSRDNGEVVRYVVTREPWPLGHGTYVIGLEGVSGGYDLRRVVAINPANRKGG